MKFLRFFLVALFAGIATSASAQVNLNDLSLAIAESPENTAALVEEAVASSPEQVQPILARLLTEYPEHAEEIILGAINGLPKPLTEEELSAVIAYAIRFSPGLAAEIVRGARRATEDRPELHTVIVESAQDVLQTISVGVLGPATNDATPESVVEGDLQISPAR